MTTKAKAARQDPEEQEQPRKASTAKAPASTQDAVPVYRTDLGESLPAQKRAGVE